MKSRTPSKPDARLTHLVSVRITEEMHSGLAAQAEAAGFTISHYCARIFQASLEAEPAA